MTNMQEEYVSAPGSISGAGGGGKGGGGGGSQAVEAENTLRSSAVVRIVEVISEGPIEGIAGGGSGVYINDTPLFNADGSSNFSRAQWDYRVGLPSQDYMPGFNGVESEILVSTAFSILTNDIVRTTSASNIDAVNVTIQLPQGLSSQDMSSGNLDGTSVSFRIDTRLGLGTYATAGTYTISGKTTSPYEASYRINRPAGAGVWSIRVTRITPDPAANVKNQTTWARFTEIQEIQVTYPDAAVVGVTIDAETVGNQIPRRAYLVKGLLIDIPSNYNPVTRAYTGAWNGLFTPSTIAVDNPVWVLYDIMTSSRYGGDVSTADIDVYSFYDAAVYCDELVPYTAASGAATTEPRFTFNARIADRPDIVKIIKAVCGAMSANLIYWNGKWTLIQDRPTSVSKLISKANVLDGLFTYKSSSLFERHTAINVSYNDRGDRYLERVVTVEDGPGLDRYGYNAIDIAAFGATTEGQAIRAGRWVLDSELNQCELCEFQMSINGFDLTPGDVVNVYDADYANNTGAGKIVSVSGTTVVLDRACTITTGSTISALLADGFTIETRSITGAGEQSTLTLTAPFSTALISSADFIITSAIAPRPFKIVDLTVPEPHIVQVMAVFYDAGKFARVESGVTVPSAVFSNQIRTVIPAPTALSLAVEGMIMPATGLPRRFLRANWLAPVTSLPIAGYNVTWSQANGNYRSFQVGAATAQIPADEDGIYNVKIYSRDYNGNVSGSPLSGSKTVSSNELTVDPSGFGAVINLVAVDTNGTTWVQNDLIIRWADNSTNLRGAVSYRIDIFTTSDVLLRTIDNYPAKQFNYDIATNTSDGSGTPRAALKIMVYAKDATGALSNPTTVTFTNPAPAAVAGANAEGMFKGAALSWLPNTEADLQGYYIWRGTSAGFAPSSANLVFKGYATKHLDGVLLDNTTYWWKIAAFDRFSFSESGAGLNIVTISATSSVEPGIRGFATAPSTGMVVGDFYFNTTDKNLYRYDGTNWRVTGAFSGTSIERDAKTGMVTGDLWSDTTNGKLYRYDGLAWVASVPVVDLTGQITTTQITDDAITTPKIAALAVTAAEIATNTITADKIAANTITAAKIAAGTITATEMAASSITAGKIAANAISTSNIQAGAITAGSGIIADLAVDTLKIAGNAVTVPAGGQGGTGPMNTSWVELTRVGIYTNVSSPIWVVASVTVQVGSYLISTPSGGAEQGYSPAILGYTPVYVLLYRNGSAIWQSQPVSATMPVTVSILDYPGAGSHTYQLAVYTEQPGYNGQYGERQAYYWTPTLVAMAAKR